MSRSTAGRIAGIWCIAMLLGGIDRLQQSGSRGKDRDQGSLFKQL